MYCKKCGFQLPNDAEYCLNCGAKVEVNGIGNIEQKAVFGGIDEDDEPDIDSVKEKAHWNSEQKQNSNVESSKDAKSRTPDTIVDERSAKLTLFEQNKNISNEYRALIKSRLYALNEKDDNEGCGTIVYVIVMIGLIGVGAYFKGVWGWLCGIGVFLMIFLVGIRLWHMDDENSDLKMFLKAKEIYKNALTEIYKISLEDIDYKMKVERIYNQCVRKVDKLMNK